MHTIIEYKLPIGPSDSVIQMPQGCKVLTAGLSGGEPHVWAEVETKNPLRPVIFAVLGTRNAIPEASKPMSYLASVYAQSYNIVYHVYVESEALGLPLKQ